MANMMKMPIFILFLQNGVYKNNTQCTKDCTPRRAHCNVLFSKNPKQSCVSFKALVAKFGWIQT